MKTEAHFSKCKNYRYALWRTWDESRPLVMIIGLNPSKTEENPTITRCTYLNHTRKKHRCLKTFRALKSLVKGCPVGVEERDA